MKSRTIKKAILHCTATPVGQRVTKKHIKHWHLLRGFSDVGYHYIILPDGTIEEGRFWKKPGAHTRGENKDSIGICYVGGTDADKKPLDTMTGKQEAALVVLMDQLRAKHGPIPLYGHNDFSKKACPSFNVTERFSPEFCMQDTNTESDDTPTETDTFSVEAGENDND